MPEGRERPGVNIVLRHMVTTIEQGAHLRTEDQGLRSARAGSITHEFSRKWNGFRPFGVGGEHQLDGPCLDFSYDGNSSHEFA